MCQEMFLVCYPDNQYICCIIGHQHAQNMMAMFAIDAASPCIWKQLAEDIVTLFDGDLFWL